MTVAGIHILVAPTGAYRRYHDCPTCGERRRAVSYDHGPWYGVETVCCACGDRWDHEYGRHRRRRALAAREARQAAEAQSDWATAMTRAQHRAWFHDRFVNPYIADVEPDPDIDTPFELEGASA